MTKRFFFLLVALGCLWLPGCSKKGVSVLPAASSYNDDIAYLIGAIERNYPYLNDHRRREGLDWKAHADSFRRTDYSSLSLREFRDNVLRALLQPLNGHTGVLDDASYSYRRYGYGGLRGKFRSMYRPWIRILEGKVARSVYVYDDTAIKRQNAVGQSIMSKSRLEVQSERDIAYLRIPTFDLDMVKIDSKAITAFLQGESGKGKPLIIDIRGNSGGSDLYWLDTIVGNIAAKKYVFTGTCFLKGGEESMPFLRSLNTKYSPIGKYAGTYAYDDGGQFAYFVTEARPIPASRHPKKFPKVFVIMDSHVFSASESFVYFCKTSGFACLVGQRSAGDGVGSDPILVQLPYSGLIVAMPIFMGLNPDGALSNEGTTPDIPLAPDIDPIEYIREYCLK